MINILLRLFTYIFFILLSCYAITSLPQSSVNLTRSAEFNLKNIDEILKCNECCIYSKHATMCDIFYTFCMTKVFYKKGVFLLTKDSIFKEKCEGIDGIDACESRVFNRINKYKNKTNAKNIIFIVMNKEVFFFDKKYVILASEVNYNIQQIEKKYNLSSDISFKKNKLDISTRFKGVELKKRPKINLNLFKNNYTNIEVIANKYISILGQDKEKNITLYNKDHKQSCIKKLKSTSIIALNTTLSSSSNLLNRTYTKKPEEILIDLPVIVVAVGVTAVIVGIIVIVSTYICKKYNRPKPEADTKLEVCNENENEKSMEHIYEEPRFYYESVDLGTDYKKDNKSSAMLSQSEEHVYIPCRKDSDCKDSNANLNDINNSASNSSLHEQQDIAIQIENDSENNRVYYVLEDSN